MEEVTDIFRYKSPIGKSITSFGIDFIEMKTDADLQSWGENIRIELKDKIENMFQYRITCKPMIPTTLIDYGHGKKMVEKIKTALEAL